MKYLLLIAHGSRRQSANDEIKLLAERVAGLDDNNYAGVVTAFLEMAEPNIALAELERKQVYSARGISIIQA